MRKLFGVFVLAVMLVGGTVFNAAAIPINGEIHFFGVLSSDIDLDTTNSLAFSLFETATLGYGDYASVPSGTPVTFSDFTFEPFAPVTPLWTFSVLNITYKFDATSRSILQRGTDTLLLEGYGTAYIDDTSNPDYFSPTNGKWRISLEEGKYAGTFVSSTTVPEPASILLVGFGLVGLAGIGRKLKK